MKKSAYSIIAAGIIGTFSSSTSAQSWMPCGSGMDQTVYAMCADTVNNVIYAGGAFVNAGTIVVNHVAKWNGTTWSAMGMNMGTNYSMIGTDDTVKALCMYQGNLYAGGHFMNAEGNTAQHIAMWNGTAWSAVGTSMNGDVHSMAVYQGQLYVSGEFTQVDGVTQNHIVRWNGTSWAAVGAGLNSDAEALIVFNGNLYAGGDFTMSGVDTCKNIAMWNGTIWTHVGSGMGTSMMMMNMGMPSIVHSFAVCNGYLYAGGMFLTAGGMGCSNLAKWNGTAWSNTGTIGTGMMSDYVTALCNYKGVLCVGGMFSSAGGQSVSNMGQCNNGAWSSLSMGANNAVFAMTTCNGVLYTGGSFTTAGGNSNAHIAQISIAAGIYQPGGDAPSMSIVYPNPLSGQTAFVTVSKSILSDHVELVISNILGQRQMTLSLSDMQQISSGVYRFTMPNPLTSGVYFYHMVDGSQMAGTGKLIIQ